ncbi:MAG: pentapeptide repeat-containing protein [Cyanophyceae cyanobacterium]
MSYCTNPSCSSPKNSAQAVNCHGCGTQLLLRDRYQIGKILGKGGFGTTFLARDLSLPGQPGCVIKQLRPSSQDPDTFRMAKELFEREAKTLGRLSNHPQIPRLLDYFEANQQFYLVQEYVSGYDLQREVKRNGPFSEAGVKQFLSEVLPLLQYIHSLQVIHRDIKPANLIRREQDRKLVLIDFGAVKDQVSAVTDTVAQTALTAFSVGTTGYAPPEQLAMRPIYASDIYALGVTCLYLLTGKPPKNLGFDSATGDITWQQHVNISDHLAQILRTMMDVSVRHRYKSADEVLKALEMEPYLDSLAQGLVSQPTSNQSSFLEDTSSPAPTNPNLSATSKLAMAIRARKERRRQQTTINTPSTLNRHQPEGISKTAFHSGRKKTVKLDAKTVASSYPKGRRDFAQQNLQGLDLQGVTLAEGIFSQSNLKNINLQEADLTSANFGRANLKQSILKKANLCRAYLGYSNLEGADLQGANLQFAHLMHANLNDANLCGANLTNAQVTKEQLALAKTNWATVLPSGKRSFW